MVKLPNKKKWKKTNKVFYVVLMVHEKLEVDVKNISGVRRLPLDLTWADGQVGVMPVFTDYADALTYAGGNEDRIIVGNA